ncbi:MAG: UDP-N-acetylmuramoyl-L-alanine--D-glutamate ligase, partial [Vicinamibacterales bacterium]
MTLRRPVFSVSGARVVVVGAARSGIAAAELLVRRGAQVTISELKLSIAEAERMLEIGVTLSLGSNDRAALDRADVIVMSPGVPLELPAVAAARGRGVPVIGELELASRWLRGRVVAVTGTKGKSTTTILVGRMLTAAGRTVLVGGNLGVPLSAQVEESTEDTIHVVEASSFQLEATDTFRPWIAALLNLSPDHLDRHPSEEAYAAAKARVFVNQTADDWAVVNGDNPAALALAGHSRATRLTYGVESIERADIFVERDFIWQRTSEGSTPLVPLASIQLAGRHMLSNVAAASAVACAAGVAGESMARAVEGFTGLEHVMEPVATIGGVRFVNDSKATNIDAAGRSIESFDRVVAIIGGRFKGGVFADLAGPLAARGRGVVAIGEARPLVRHALGRVVPCVEADSMHDAVAAAYQLARPDGVVLLAPACSSFDMFADYADRGRVFKAEVRGLVEHEERRTK